MHALHAPEFDLVAPGPAEGGRVVERHVVPRPDARADAGVERQQGRFADKPLRADGAERVGGLIGHHQGDAVDDQRLGDAGDQAVGEPRQVEVGAQVAGESHQGPPIVVPVAVERAVEDVLHGVLDAARQQHDHHRREHRDDRVARAAGEDPAHHAEQHGIEGHDPCRRRDIDQAALDDDLHVHQPVAHDGRRERQRDEPERHRQQFHLGRRRHADGERERVAEGERRAAEQRAPDNPAQLAARGDGAGVRQGVHEDRQPAEQAGAQVERLEPVEGGDHREQLRVAIEPRDRHHARAAHDERGQVDQRQEAGAERRADALARALREHQGEMQEHGRQGKQRHHVGPVEDPVEPVEPARKREGEDAEERHRQPEQVQRRLVARPAQAYPCPDHEREDPDRGEDEIEEAVALRDRREPDLHDLAGAQAQQRVGQRGIGAGRMRRADHVRRALHRTAVNRQQHITQPYARLRRGRPVRQFGGRDAVRTGDPQHAVLDLVPGRPDVDVRETESEEDQHHRERRRTSQPRWAGCPLRRFSSLILRSGTGCRTSG